METDEPETEMLSDYGHLCRAFDQLEKSPEDDMKDAEKQRGTQCYKSVTSRDYKALRSLADDGGLHQIMQFASFCSGLTCDCPCLCARMFECFPNVLVSNPATIETLSSGSCRAFHDLEHFEDTSYQSPQDHTRWSKILNGLIPKREKVYASLGVRNPGITALHLAVALGDMALAKWLLTETEMHKSINDVTRLLGYSALHLAVLRRNIDMVDLLIDFGANVSAISPITDQSPVMLCVMNTEWNLPQVDTVDDSSYAGVAKSTDILELLMQKGADINRGISDGGESPLEVAIRTEHWLVISILVQAGAEQCITRANGKREWLLHKTLSPGSLRFSVATVLLDGDRCGLNEPDANGEYPLHLAINHSHHIYGVSAGEPFIQKMIDKGADVNKLSNDQPSPLCLALFQGSTGIAQLLLRSGARLDLAGKDGYLPLHPAAWEGQLNICKYILDTGAPHDLQTPDKNTPLALACHGNHYDVIKLLLERPCDVNNADKDDDTPIHYTTWNESVDATRLLLEHGADPDVENSSRTTPLWYAAEFRNVELMRLLLRYNVRVDIPSRGTNQDSYDAAPSYLYAEPLTPFAIMWPSEADAEPFDYVTLYRLLRLAGVSRDVQKILANVRKRFELPDEDDTSMERVIVNMFEKPLTLLCSARIAIRRHYGKDLRKTIPAFELPYTLNEFLVNIG